MGIYLNWLLIFGPIALVLHFVAANDTYVFVAAGLSIIPLAGLMGQSTENLSQKTGPGIGSLINATFGNATELIISIMALKQGYIEIVRASMSGAIIGNILLVMGSAIIVGGIRNKEVIFNPQAVGMGTALLSLASISLIMPTLFKMTTPNVTEQQLDSLSLAVCIVMIICYIGYLFFCLKTHRHLFRSEETEEEGEHVWSIKKSIIMLIAVTVGLAVMAELLVDSIEHVAKSWGLSNTFMGVFLLAVMGNAAEFGSVLMAAMKNKMELAIQLAIGSSAQIALLVIPVLVFLSFIWIPMDLIFNPFEVVGIVVAVAVSQILLLDGKSHWMEGLLLIGTYIILGISFYFHP